MRITRGATLLAGLTGLASACSLPISTPSVTKPPIVRVEASPRELLAQLEARYSTVHTFQSKAEIRSASPRGRERMRELIVVERPSRIRIDMLGIFGVGLQVGIDETRINAYHKGERTLFRGKSTVESLARFTRLPLPVNDLVDLLLGLPPHRMPREPQLLEFEPLFRRWRLHTTIGDGAVQILWFDEQHKQPTRVEEYDALGKLLYIVEFRAHKRIGEGTIPRKIQIRVPDRNTSVAIHYSELSINEPIPGTPFLFDPPDGTKIIELKDKAATR